MCMTSSLMASEGQINLDDLYPRIVEAMNLEEIQIHLNAQCGVFLSEEDRLSVFDLDDDRRVDDVRQLVDFLEKMDRKAFEELCSLLTEHGHSDLAQELTRRRLSYESGAFRVYLWFTDRTSPRSRGVTNHSTYEHLTSLLLVMR